MIEVKMKTISATPEGNYGVGDKRSVSEDEARALVDGGYAEYAVLPVPKPTQEAPEKAVSKPVEVAAQPVAAPGSTTAQNTPNWNKK